MRMLLVLLALLALTLGSRHAHDAPPTNVAGLDAYMDSPTGARALVAAYARASLAEHHPGGTRAVKQRLVDGMRDSIHSTLAAAKSPRAQLNQLRTIAARLEDMQ